MAVIDNTNKKIMKVGIIQFAPLLGDLNGTIKKLDSLIDKTGSADLVVLPELANSGYNFVSPQQAYDLAESIDNSIYLDFIAKKACDNNNFIVTGFNEKDGDKLYSTSVLIGPDGYIGQYRKIHLFLNEKDYFSQGDKGLPVFDIGICKIGMLVCFDWVFPEVWRILALKGADIICHPSNLVLPYAQKVVPSHALVNRVFALTVNRVGTEGKLTFTGRSILSNPKGETLFEASTGKEEAAIIEIDPLIARNKSMTPRNDLFKDRIPEEYEELVKPGLQ
jgi:predicted amidohydrolase